MDDICIWKNKRKLWIGYFAHLIIIIDTAIVTITRCKLFYNTAHNKGHPSLETRQSERERERWTTSQRHTSNTSRHMNLCSSFSAKIIHRAKSLVLLFSNSPVTEELTPLRLKTVAVLSLRALLSTSIRKEKIKICGYIILSLSLAPLFLPIFLEIKTIPSSRKSFFFPPSVPLHSGVPHRHFCSFSLKEMKRGAKVKISMHMWSQSIGNKSRQHPSSYPYLSSL